eukprot:gb/GECH01007615.1/.p1 GENE.gb/GECH01007615.1/~~gb/GECH01007615.1/.p1  ORF type:complete len:199 (+),score=52.58 gb/GECH01007615.1/:1-597(+)
MDNILDHQLKCVVVGDGNVGKTCLLISFAENRFPEEYVPTVFDNYNANIMYEKNAVSLGLWDTAGSAEYDKLRIFSYPDSNVILVVFSLVNPASLKQVKEKWVPEIKEHAPDVPFLLVGNKLDLRDDSKTVKSMEERGMKPLATEEGIKMTKEVGAKFYLECSAKTQQGVKDVFQTAIRCVLNPESLDEKAKKNCVMQ